LNLVPVHPNDATRLDLIIPGEAHFYVKAATPQERQQWLVALGSSKACLSNNCLPLPSSPTAANAGLGISSQSLSAAAAAAALK